MNNPISNAERRWRGGVHGTAIVLFLAVVLALFFAPAGATRAQTFPEETTGNFQDIGAFTATIERFQEGIRNKIAIVTNVGGDYYRIALMLMVAFCAIYLVIALTKYATQGKDWPDLLGAFAHAALVMALFLTYGETVDVLSNAPRFVTSAIQRAALGTDDAFAPLVYLFKIVTQIQFKTEDVSFWDVLGAANAAMSAGLFAVVFLLIQAAYLLAIIYATIWPMLYFFALKIVGFVMIPFLLTGKLDFIFFGWLKQFFMLIIFVLIVNGVMIATVLLVAEAFNIQFDAPTPGQTIISGALARVLVIATLIFGVVAILQAQKIAASWTGADSLGDASSAVRRIVSRGMKK